MAHNYEIRNSRPIDRDYNEIGVNKGEDVYLTVPIEHDEWVSNGYNITIYDEKLGTTLVSVSLDDNPKEIIIDDFSFNTKKALITVEDRSDINDIEFVETIAYIRFKVFDRKALVVNQEGTLSYTNVDDSTTSIPYYSTTFDGVIVPETEDGITASEIIYDNFSSGLSASLVQGAIDEVEGRVDTAESKLSGIEANATADQTAGEIKTAYESNTDTNAYTDSEKSKLAGIESGATTDQTASEIKTSYESNADTNAYTNSEKTKLGTVESGATADQTDAEIKTAYENNPDTNAFTDSEKTKLGTVESNAKDDQNAVEVPYDNSTSGLTATDVKAALDEIAAAGGTDDQTAAEVTYDNSTSGLSATDVKAALDEVAASGGTDDQTASEVPYDNSSSGLTATDTQAAVDEVEGRLDSAESKLSGIESGATADQDADEVPYVNTTTGLNASDVQNAVDKLYAGLTYSAIGGDLNITQIVP